MCVCLTLCGFHRNLVLLSLSYCALQIPSVSERRRRQYLWRRGLHLLQPAENALLWVLTPAAVHTEKLVWNVSPVHRQLVVDFIDHLYQCQQWYSFLHSTATSTEMHLFWWGSDLSCSMNLFPPQAHVWQKITEENLIFLAFIWKRCCCIFEFAVSLFLPRHKA